MATATDPTRKFGPSVAKIIKIGRMRTYFGPPKKLEKIDRAAARKKKIALLLDSTIPR